MFPTAKEISTHIKNFAIKVSNEVSKDIVDFDMLYDIRIKTNMGTGCLAYAYAKQGKFGIQFNIGAFLEREIAGMREYKSFCFDRHIGGFATSDWKILIETIFIHELAHIVHYHYNSELNGSNSKKIRNDGKPHGDTFKAIYKLLRMKYIDDRVEGVGSYRANVFFVPVSTETYDEVIKKHLMANNPKMYNKLVILRNVTYKVIGQKPNARLYKFILDKVESQGVMSQRVSISERHLKELAR